MINYGIPTTYKFNNFIFKLPEDTQELRKYAEYIYCITGGNFYDLIEKHNNEWLIFGVYFAKNNYWGKLLEHKDNLGFILLIPFQDNNIIFDMAIDAKRCYEDIDYNCIIESIYCNEDEMAKIKRPSKKLCKS